MKKALLCSIVLLVALILVSCAPPTGPSSNELDAEGYYDECSTGVTIKEVPVNQEALNSSFTAFYAYIFVPNAGCELPKQYCLIYSDAYKGGISCTVID